MSEVQAIRETVDESRGPGAFAMFLRQLRKSPLGLMGAVLVVLMVASAVFATWIVPYDPIKIMVGPRLAPPSLDFLLGTDQLGRDVF